MIKNLAVDAAMLTIFAHMILLGALEYSISQTSDDGLKRKRSTDYNPLRSPSALSVIEDYCRGNPALQHIGRLAAAARLSLVAVWIVSPIALLMAWV